MRQVPRRLARREAADAGTTGSGCGCGKGAGIGAAGTGACGSDGAWMVFLQMGQGPLTPAILAGTVSLVAQAGQKKVRVGPTVSFVEPNRLGNVRQ